MESCTKIDYLAHKYYVECLKKDATIHDNFLYNFFGFVGHHRKDKMNLSFYYNFADLELRRLKIIKLKEIINGTV